MRLFDDLGIDLGLAFKVSKAGPYWHCFDLEGIFAASELRDNCLKTDP